MKAIATFAAAMIAGGSAASAHHIWLEPDGQQVRLYFGEFGENLREASPGMLDKIEPQVKAGERALRVEKAANGFVISGKLEASDSIVAEDARFPVFAQTRSLYWPAARLVTDRAVVAPVLALDVVPAAGGKYQVSFKGRPLAKAKVEVLTPSGWSRELRTGEDGTIDVALPWRGTYVIEVHHTDKTAGKRGEEAYDQVNYVTSLTVVQGQGLDPLPALPAAKPH